VELAQEESGNSRPDIDLLGPGDNFCSIPILNFLFFFHFRSCALDIFAYPPIYTYNEKSCRLRLLFFIRYCMW
jgi:hypothetical protein